MNDFPEHPDPHSDDLTSLLANYLDAHPWEVPDVIWDAIAADPSWSPGRTTPPLPVVPHPSDSWQWVARLQAFVQSIAGKWLPQPAMDDSAEPSVAQLLPPQEILDACPWLQSLTVFKTDENLVVQAVPVPGATSHSSFTVCNPDQPLTIRTLSPASRIAFLPRSPDADNTSLAVALPLESHG